MVTILSRADWDARPPRCSSPTDVAELYLHHSVGSGMRDKNGDGDLGDDYMRQMQNQHMKPGWAGTVNGGCDIAYNHAHDPDGREFYEGRGFDIRPGAQKSHNTGTHALVIMGDFRVRPVTPQLVEDIAGFYRTAIADGLLPAVEVRGHRHAPNQSTTCPGGNLVAALPEINALIQEAPVQKEPLRSWARDPFEWMITNGYYTEETDLDEIRETYDFQQITVNQYRAIRDLHTRIDGVAGGGGVSLAQVDQKIDEHAANPDAHHE